MSTYTSIPKLSLLQGRSIIICHGDARYLLSKCLYRYSDNLMLTELLALHTMTYIIKVCLVLVQDRLILSV